MRTGQLRYRVGLFGRLVLQVQERVGPRFLVDQPSVVWRDARADEFLAPPTSPSLLLSASAALLEPESLSPADRLRLAADLEQAAGAQA